MNIENIHTDYLRWYVTHQSFLNELELDHDPYPKGTKPMNEVHCNTYFHEGAFEKGHYEYSVFRWCYFDNCDLTRDNLNGAVFIECDFEDCKYHEESMVKCNLIERSK